MRPPHRRAVRAGAWSRSIWAPRCPSNVGYGWRVTASPSTRNNPMPPSGNCGADHQGVGAVAGEHRVLPSAQRPRITLLHSRSRDSFGGGARAPGSRWANASSRCPAATSSSSCFWASLPSSAIIAPGPSAACTTGSGASRRPTSVSTHHDLDLARLVGVESQAENPGVGELSPHLAAPAQVGGDDLVAALGVVAARQQVAGGVAEQDLLVAQLKVHGLPHKPRMVDAMMLRCTSLLPP